MNADPKQALLAAGAALAPTLALEQLDEATLAAAAGLPASALRDHFGDLDTYLVALQQRFMTGLRDVVVAHAGAQPDPAARLREGGIAYLDECLRQHALRSWFIEGRRGTVALAEGLHKQNQPYLLILAGELRTLGWPHPQAGARLFLSALLEVGRDEHGHARPLPALRAALWEVLETYSPRNI